MYSLRDMFDLTKLVSRHFKIKYRPDLFHIKIKANRRQIMKDHMWWRKPFSKGAFDFDQNERRWFT